MSPAAPLGSISPDSARRPRSARIKLNDQSTLIKVANAPVSWGVIEFDLEGQTAGPAQVLDEIQETGYNGTELGDWGFLPTDPEELGRALQARELELLGAFVPVALAEPEARAGGISRALRAARLLAAVSGEDPFIILSDDNGTVALRTENAGRIGPEHGLSEHEWDVFASGAVEIAAVVNEEAGLRTVFHHHCAGYVETPSELEALMARTDPSLLGLCLDTGHYAFGGGDPVEAAERYADRLWHVHFKDCHPDVAASSRSEGWDYFRSVREGIFAELGRGDVDFAGMLSNLKHTGYDGWIVVEQDVLPGLGSPKESAARNRAHLRELGL